LLLGGFEPAAGQSFELLTTAQGVSGMFSDVQLPGLSGGKSWIVDYRPTSVVLTAVPETSGLVGAAIALVAMFGAQKRRERQRRFGHPVHSGSEYGRR
jgi:hypothetical protein